jgi:hypothetical protein
MAECRKVLFVFDYKNLRQVIEGCANKSPLQSTLCGADLGTHRIQRAVVAGYALKSNGATRRDCSLEAMRTQGDFPISSQASFPLLSFSLSLLSYSLRKLRTLCISEVENA